MARVDQVGFETNQSGGSAEVAAAGSAVIQTSVVRSGVYAGQITSLVTATRRYFQKEFAGSSQAGPFFFRVYMRFDTLPSAENRIISFLSTANPATGTHLVYATIDNTGVLKLYTEDGQITGTTTLSTTTWYRLEFKFGRDATPNAGADIAIMLVDGATIASTTTASLSANFRTWNVGGNINAEAQTAGNWYVDDIAVNNTTGSFQTSYPGSGKIVHLMPSAVGDANAWTRAGTDSGANWSQVNEIPPNDATNSVSSNTLNQSDLYNLADSTSEISASDTINVVSVGQKWAGVGSSANASLKLQIEASASGTVEQSASVTRANTSWFTADASQQSQLVLYDLPGASTTVWTKADLDAAQIGVQLSATNTNAILVSTIWLSVDFTPASGQDTPELYGRPYGARGQNQMHQLLAQ